MSAKQHLEHLWPKIEAALTQQIDSAEGRLAALRFVQKSVSDIERIASELQNHEALLSDPRGVADPVILNRNMRVYQKGYVDGLREALYTVLELTAVGTENPTVQSLNDQKLFQDVYRVSKHLVLISDSHVTALEYILGFSLPPGYRAFMTTLGKGTYCDTVAMFPPEQILAEYADAREGWASFWNGSNLALSPEQLRMSVPLAKTGEGDQIIFCPAYSERLFVLPRHDDMIYWIPEGFGALLHWVGPVKVINEQPTFTYFETFYEARQQISLYNKRPSLPLSDLVQIVKEQWKLPVARELNEDGEDYRYILLFLPTIGGLAQFEQEMGNEQSITASISYDPEYVDIVLTLAKALNEYRFE